MRSIVGISLIDFTSANGPRDKIVKGLRMPSIMESYHEDFTNPSWYESIIEGIRRPFAILSLGPFAILKSIREIPTILLMNWAFRKGLMEFGVYKCRG